MLTPKQVEKLKYLRKMGFGYRIIAKELNCSVSTVQRWCQKLGLNKNPRFHDDEEEFQRKRKKFLFPDMYNLP